jgi:sorbitol-6-phosphate 2-dehydrogenase
MKLEDRVAIVTGSAQGLGAANARKLDAEGAKVVVADINADGVEKVAGELSEGVAIPTDVISP